MLRYLCFFAAVFSVKGALAPFITPCNNGDSACILASARAALPVLADGVPALNIQPLDPLKIAHINGDQGGLELTFDNTVLTGMKTCSIDALRHDLSKGRQVTTIRCTVDLNGDYRLGGQLLLLPIKGEGRYTISIQDIVIKVSSSLSTVTGADGKPHWHVGDFRDSYQVKTGTQFHFDNLFNGNALLAKPIQDFVNTNWREVMTEIAPPIVHAIVGAVVERVEALYKAVPAEELYLP